MANSVIVAGARTPIGKLGGALAPLGAASLGASAISAALTRAGVDPSDVDYVFMGHVLQAGQGQSTARQAAVGAGIPMSVPATTVNKVCLSGLHAIYLADLMIRSGEAEIVVAGGMESMTNAPHLIPKLRGGVRIGHASVLDSLMVDGLTNAFGEGSMGDQTEGDLTGSNITRARQDDFAARSHERASHSAKAGHLAEEIAEVEVDGRTGPTGVVQDEGIRPETTVDALSRLRPAFGTGGTITAGNASQISDGAAALVLASPAAASRLSEPLGHIAGYGQVAGPGTSLLTQPSNAARAAMARAGWSVSDVDVFEINEAFAAVVLASMDDLAIGDGVVNPNGGAIAIGHPIGASGTRIALSLLYELARRGGGQGVAALCGGGGQGDALAVRSGRP